MSGSGGFAVSRRDGGDRFYNPPAIRRHQQLLLQQQQQQQQLQRQNQQLHRIPPVPAAQAEEVTVPVPENRTDSDYLTGTLSRPSSACSTSVPRAEPENVTNLDRLLESVTPCVPTRNLTEVRGGRSREVEPRPFYLLGDLWEAYREWSVYGAGVPLVLHERYSIIQYYVPYLSGMQLYVDPRKHQMRVRRPGEENEAESSRETSSTGSSDCEADRRINSASEGLSTQHNLVNLSFQQLNRLSLRDKLLMNSSSDEAEISDSPGRLVFEYLEQQPPHLRQPLTDKVSVLASQFPELKLYRSSDLLPSSWICVAWYPIYRIPVGPTLKDLEASFLTFHSLSTHPRSNGQAMFPSGSGPKAHVPADPPSSVSLPIFGLASYKLKGSIITPCGPHECEQENLLWQAAGVWLQRLHVLLPDYQFFLSHYSQWR